MVVCCGQDKDKLPAPLQTLDLGSAFKGGVREGGISSPSNTDRIIQHTVGITSSPGSWLFSRQCPHPAPYPRLCIIARAEYQWETVQDNRV